MENMSYKMILKSKDNLRKEVWAMMMKNEMHISQTADSIGITRPTLRNFLIHEKSVRVITLAKIRNWLDKQGLERK